MITYAQFGVGAGGGGQTEFIMGDSKIENGTLFFTSYHFIPLYNPILYSCPYVAIVLSPGYER